MTQQWTTSPVLRLPGLRCAVLAAAVLTAGCSSTDFESVTTVSKTRLIGLIASPPDVASGETMEVDATIARARGAVEPLHFEWSLCLFDEGPNGFYRCAENIDELPVSNILASSTDEQFVFEQNVLSDEAINAACDLLKDVSENAQIPPEFAASLPRCVIGLPVRLRLKVCEGAAGCDDTEAQIASTKVQLLFDEYAQRSDRNVNPTIHSLVLAGHMIPANEPLELQVESSNTELEIRLGATAANAAQTFTPLGEGEDDSAEDKREELQSDWYTTAGKFKGRRRFFREGTTPDEEFTENKITFVFDEVEDGQIVDIWVTLRDSRGGNAVIRRQVLLRK